MLVFFSLEWKVLISIFKKKREARKMREKEAQKKNQKEKIT